MARVLRAGGRLVFTDPLVVTGALTADEIAVRSSIGFFLFVPAGLDERLLDQAGFDVSETPIERRTCCDGTASCLQPGGTRGRPATVEGDATFEGTHSSFA